MYQTKFHKGNLSEFTFLVTGGAGFIGSNIVEYLMKFGAKKVTVLDNLSTGYMENISEYLSESNFEFINGDIRDYDTCLNAVGNVDFVSHQAALGSVPRSIEDPVTSNNVNISGFLNMLQAVKQCETRRFVYAASSSTYGDSPDLPKIEGNEGKPLSPYAITKLVNELYADIFSTVYDYHTIGLRYFNVFGPRQNANNPYAAVIPKVCQAYIEGTKFTVNGDGSTSRDFTFVENAVQANIRALFLNDLESHEVFNVACGEQNTLLDLISHIKTISGHSIPIEFGLERPGDVRHSMADISKAKAHLVYKPGVMFEAGLSIAYKYYKEAS